MAGVPRGGAERAAASTARTAVDVLVCVGLAIFALSLRTGPLGPNGLFLDDAWVALVWRASTLQDALLTSVTSPGFTLLLWGWLALVGFSELNAQIPALAFGIACPFVLFLTARRWGADRISAAGAAALLALSRTHIVYSARVKQYTLDCLLVCILVYATRGLVEQPADRRAWLRFLALSVVATVMSGAVAPVVLACFLVPMIASRRVTGPMAASALCYGLFGLCWWAFVLAPSVNESLREYWAGYYILPADGVWQASGNTVTALGNLLRLLEPVPRMVSVLVVPLAFVVVLVRRHPVLPIFVIPIGVGMAMSALQMAPLGGGRTDLWLLPLFPMLIAISIALLPLGTWLRGLLIAAAVLGIAGQRRGVVYPGQDISPLVEQLETTRSESDSVLIWGWAQFQYALHTSYPVAISPVKTGPVNYSVAVEAPRVIVMPVSRPAIRDPRQVTIFLPYVEKALSSSASGRTWFLVAQQERLATELLEGHLARHGIRATIVATSQGAFLALLERTA